MFYIFALQKDGRRQLVLKTEVEEQAIAFYHKYNYANNLFIEKH